MRSGSIGNGIALATLIASSSKHQQRRKTYQRGTTVYRVAAAYGDKAL